MAKKNEVGFVRNANAEVLEGEIILPNGDKAEPKEDFSGEYKHIADTPRKFTALCQRIAAHSKEGRRLMALGAASAVAMVITTGDVQYIDEFLASLGDEHRKNSFRRYFETVGPVAWDRERMVPDGKGGEKKQAGFVLHKAKQSKAARARSTDKAKFDTGLMAKAPWQMGPAEAEYKSFDLVKYLAAGIKNAERVLSPDYIKKTGATEEEIKSNNLKGLDEVKALVAKLTAGKKNVHTGNEARH